MENLSCRWQAVLIFFLAISGRPDLVLMMVKKSMRFCSNLPHHPYAYGIGDQCFGSREF